MSEAPSAPNPSNLLVIVIDTNPSQAVLREQQRVLTHCLNAVLVLCNGHLMMSSRNKLAVIASHTNTCQYLYSDKLHEAFVEGTSEQHTKAQGGQYELFSQVDNCIKQRVKEVMTSEVQSVQTDSLIGGAMAMALCYVHRIEKEIQVGETLSSRILVITGAGDSTSQYMNFMNVFFTAQKQNILIDACVIGKDSGLLQQGCDITGGIYLNIPQLAGLLQYLLWAYLPDRQPREKMVLPPPVQVDYRAACFCHRNLVEIGYVCSVCLSIFCTFSPICSTCQTVFKFMAPPPMLKGKKKKVKLM